jgi:hypothetical protein
MPLTHRLQLLGGKERAVGQGHVSVHLVEERHASAVDKGHVLAAPGDGRKLISSIEVGRAWSNRCASRLGVQYGGRCRRYVGPEQQVATSVRGG